MDPQLEKDIAITLRKSQSLPFPANYLRYSHPGLAYVIVKVLEHHKREE